MSSVTLTGTAALPRNLHISAIQSFNVKPRGEFHFSLGGRDVDSIVGGFALWKFIRVRRGGTDDNQVWRVTALLVGIVPCVCDAVM